jgi:peptidoglycan/LPS O-acetylase OafA/YrhL
MGFKVEFINGIIGTEWAVFVEFSFYLVLPIIIKLFKQFKYYLILFSVVLSLLGTVLPRLFDLPVQIRAYIYFLPSSQLCFFLGGMFIAEIDASSKINKVKES